MTTMTAGHGKSFIPMQHMFFRCWLICTLGLLAIPGHSQKTWNGSVSDDWDVAANWTPSGVPLATETVTIPVAGTDPVIRNGVQAHSRSVRIMAGARLTVEQGGSLGAETSGFRGIWNDGRVDNDGEIVIDDTATDGLFNGLTGLFNNTGTVSIGGVVGIGLNGVLNSGTINNQAGTISIDRTANGGFVNLNAAIYLASSGAVLQMGSFGGPGTISQAAIVNQGVMTNDASTMTIDNTPRIGISNFGTLTNLNGGNVVIGGVGSVGLEGINNSGTFLNTNANLFIDRTLDDAVLNVGSFTNSNNGLVRIGQSGGAGTIGQNGISNISGFTNDAGTIVIDNIVLSGLVNSGGGAMFSNANGGEIVIGENGPIGQQALRNFFANSFENHVCSDIHVFDNIVHQNASLVNDGFLRINSSQFSSVIGAGFINNGVIEDIEGTFPAASATNNALIVQPASGLVCPGSVQDVLLTGGGSFTVSDQWYSDEVLTSFGGDYDAVLNVFTESGLGNGIHTLYFEATSTCTRVLSIRLTLTGSPAVEICNGIDDDCDGEIDETDLQVSLPACRTVYPGYAPAESTTLTADVSGGVLPYTYLWSPGGDVTESITVSPAVTTGYTVDVTDAHGCTVSEVTLVEAVNVSCGNGKVELCHQGKTKCLSVNAVEQHLAHGDLLGACDLVVCEPYLPEGQNLIVSPISGSLIEEEFGTFEPDALAIYPNPALGSAALRIAGNHKTGVLHVFDLGGIVHLALDVVSGESEVQIPLQGLNNGMYFVQVQLDDVVFVRTLVVE